MIQRIGSVTLTVSDLDRAAGFYENILGLEKKYHYKDYAWFDCEGVEIGLTRIIHQGSSRKPEEARQYGHPQGRGPEACFTTRRGPEARGRPEWRAYLGLQQDPDE